MKFARAFGEASLETIKRAKERISITPPEQKILIKTGTQMKTELQELIEQQEALLKRMKQLNEEPETPLLPYGVVFNGSMSDTLALRNKKQTHAISFDPDTNQWWIDGDIRHDEIVPWSLTPVHGKDIKPGDWFVYDCNKNSDLYDFCLCYRVTGNGIHSVRWVNNKNIPIEVDSFNYEVDLHKVIRL